MIDEETAQPTLEAYTQGFTMAMYTDRTGCTRLADLVPRGSILYLECELDGWLRATNRVLAIKDPR